MVALPLVHAVQDEECLRPGNVDDLTFLKRLDETFAKHAHYSSHSLMNFEQRKHISREEFRIHHYAGMALAHPHASLTCPLQAL
jgi:myosin-1